MTKVRKQQEKPVTTLSNRQAENYPDTSAINNHSRLENYLDHLPHAVFALDQEWHFSYSNSNSCSLFGREKEALIGASLLDILPGFQKSVFYRLYQDAWEQGEELHREDTFTHPSGSTRRYLMHAKPIENELLIVAEDRTDLRRAQMELKAYQARSQAILDALPDIIFRLSRSGIFLDFHASPSRSRIPRFLSDTIIGKNARDVVPPEVLNDCLHHIEQCFRSNSPTRFTCRLKVDDNHDSVFEARAVAIDDSEALVLLRDITDLEQVESKKRRTEEHIRRVQRVETLSHMAGSIAHDFNNLLTSIIGNATLAMMDIPADSAARDELDQILDASRRAGSLARQMLTYSGRMTFSKRDTNLSRFIREREATIKSMLPKTMALALELEDKIPDTYIDTDQISQALDNIIVNAIEACHDHGSRLTIRTGKTVLAESDLEHAHYDIIRKDGEFVFLEVEDDGDGIEADNIPKVFDPFYSTKFTGRGLGLAAVSGTIRGHKGAILIKSEPGKRTRFRLLLPHSQNEKNSSQLSPRPEQKSARKDDNVPIYKANILLVEDDPYVHRYITRVLERYDYRILLAETGQKAIDLFERDGDGIDIAILDLTLPRMSGREVFNRLRSIKTDLPVLVSSGMSEDIGGSMFAGESACRYLSKPYTPANLIEMIERMLQESCEK